MNQLKTNSIKSNFLFTFLYKLTMLLFPLVSFPYVSRILGPVGIGQVNFAKSLTQYFIMFSTLGIPIYGIREIAKCRNNLIKLKKTFTQLITLSSFFAFISTGLYYLMIFNFSRFEQTYSIFAILGINIIFSVFAIDWFFNGIEAFKKVAIRSLIIKIISLCGIFILIKEENDTSAYAFIFVLLYAGDSLLNLFLSFRFLDFNYKLKDLSRHVKPILIFSFLSVTSTIFLNLDSVMLGFLANDQSVGLYNSAIKINRIVIVLVTTITTVLIPRLSYYSDSKQMDKFFKMLKTSISSILFIAIPSAVGLILLSDDIIVLFSGTKFLIASDTMKILALLIPIVGISQMFSLQVLVPLNAEDSILKSYIIGAFINISLNIFLIPRYSHFGAALATIISEFFLCLILYIVVWKSHQIKLLTFKHMYYVLGSILFIPVIFILKENIEMKLLLLGTSILSCIFIYFIFLYLLKEEISVKILEFAKQKLKIN